MKKKEVSEILCIAMFLVVVLIAICWITTYVVENFNPIISIP